MFLLDEIEDWLHTCRIQCKSLTPVKFSKEGRRAVLAPLGSEIRNFSVLKSYLEDYSWIRHSCTESKANITN